MTKLSIIKASSKYLDFLAARGLDVEVVTDLESVPRLACEVGRDYQLPTFSIDRMDHTESTAFWMFLKRGTERIAGAAAILQDIGQENFDGYLRRVARRQYPNPSGEAVDRIARPLGDQVSGRLAYIGELSVDPNERGRRDNLAAFMRLLQALVVLEWGVDWTYAFVPARHVRGDLDRLYGFTVSIPNAQRWRDPVPERRASTEWFVGAQVRHLEWMFEAELDAPEILGVVGKDNATVR